MMRSCRCSSDWFLLPRLARICRKPFRSAASAASAARACSWASRCEAATRPSASRWTRRANLFMSRAATRTTISPVPASTVEPISARCPRIADPSQCSRSGAPLSITPASTPQSTSRQLTGVIRSAMKWTSVEWLAARLADWRGDVPTAM